MPTNDLAIRFTEEKYATKNEVIKDLKISSVDSFWSNIIAYRSNFYHFTQLTSIEKKQFVFCGCPSVNGVLINIENKLLKVNRNFSSLFANPTELKFFTVLGLSKCLKNISDKNNFGLDIELLKSYIRKESNLDENAKFLSNYLNALNYVKDYHVNSIDDTYIAKLYSLLLGTDELVSFYRENDDSNRENRVLIDRVYTCAPANLIEEMMNSLYKFLSSSSLSAGVKASIAYYYISYIRPFDTYSDEIAILVAKSVLGHESLGELCVYLPLEEILSNNVEAISKIFGEVQKNADLTYFVNYFFKLLTTNCDELLDLMANLNAELLKSDFYKEDNQQASEYQPEQVSKLAQNNQVTAEQTSKVSYVQEELAINKIPLALDEKQATLLEQDLLERDPSLRKGEAHFYARHCTKDKKYTIAQYKKCVGCVYETARTSMDHLAELGYYRKEKIKNKFVYVPITRD